MGRPATGHVEHRNTNSGVSYVAHFSRLRISEACQQRWRAVDCLNDLLRIEDVGKATTHDSEW